MKKSFYLMPRRKTLKKSNREYDVLFAAGNQMAKRTGDVRSVLPHLILLKRMRIVQLWDVIILGSIQNVSLATSDHHMRNGMKMWNSLSLLISNSHISYSLSDKYFGWNPRGYLVLPN
jgi:hypothetical protein